MHTTSDDYAYCCACQERVRVNHRGVAFDDIPTCNECNSDELDWEYEPPDMARAERDAAEYAADKQYDTWRDAKLEQADMARLMAKER